MHIQRKMAFLCKRERIREDRNARKWKRRERARVSSLPVRRVASQRTLRRRGIHLTSREGFTGRDARDREKRSAFRFCGLRSYVNRSLSRPRGVDVDTRQAFAVTGKISTRDNRARPAHSRGETDGGIGRQKCRELAVRVKCVSPRSVLATNYGISFQAVNRNSKVQIFSLTKRAPSRRTLISASRNRSSPRFTLQLYEYRSRAVLISYNNIL